MQSLFNPIVGLGEVLWDILPTGPRLGGAPANFAFHASQLGTPAVVVSAVGKDPLADQTRQQLETHGLGFLFSTNAHPTGEVGVSVDSTGSATYDIRPEAAWDYLELTREMHQLAKSVRAVCFGTLSQRSPVSRTAVREFLANTSDTCLRICDINLRPPHYSAEVIEESIRLCNILKVSSDEQRELNVLLGLNAESPIATSHLLLQRYGLQILIVTCGEHGSHVYTPESHYFLPAKAIVLADTVGAGDSFTGAFCAALLRGDSIRQAHQLAVEVSAHVCAHHGAMVAWPKKLAL